MPAGRRRPVRSRTDQGRRTARRRTATGYRRGTVSMGGQPPPPGAVTGLRPGHHLPAPPPAPTRDPPRLPRAAASRRGDPAHPHPADHRPAIPARRPHRRPGRGNHAAMGTGILTRLAARAGPHRRHTPAAGTIPPATAHDHITGQVAGPALTARLPSEVPPKGRPGKASNYLGKGGGFGDG